MITKRCIIYAKDVQRIPGKSDRYRHLVLAKVSQFFRDGKRRKQST